MKNINSGSELFEGKKTYNHNTHYSMPKIRYNKKRRRVTYQGIVNQDPVKIVLPVLPKVEAVSMSAGEPFSFDF